MKDSSSTKEKSESDNGNGSENFGSMHERDREEFMGSFASFIKNIESNNGVAGVPGAPKKVDFCQQVDLKCYENMIVDRADVDSFIDDFVRLFRLSKRSIEYLIYTQNYLKSITMALEQKFKTIESQMEQDLPLNSKRGMLADPKPYNANSDRSLTCRHCGKIV